VVKDLSSCFSVMVNFVVNLQFIMVFGAAVLNRPTVAAVVKDHHVKILNMLESELVREKVSVFKVFKLVGIP